MVLLYQVHIVELKNLKDDLVLIKFDNSCYINGFFTLSSAPGEPVKWNKKIIKQKKGFSYSNKFR